MSYIETLQTEAAARRERFRHPANAVEDHGIDLKRKPVVVIPISHVEEAQPVVIESAETDELLELETQIAGLNKKLDRLYERHQLVANQRRPNIRDIQDLVCAHFRISLMDLLSQRRAAAVVRPRQIAMYLVKTLTLRSLPEVGRHFGGRDHTTVLHAVRKIDGLKESNPPLAAELADLTAQIQAT